VTTTNVFDLARYWYTNGRPSRIELAAVSDDGQTLNSYATYYIKYDWHGNATAIVDSGGGGGNDWGSYNNVYGVWGEHGDWGVGYYDWSAAWGYLRFTGKINFDLNDTLDIGLYYAHGRWYNQDTGLYLSPNEKGDYIYNQNDPVNQAQVDSCLNHQTPKTPPVGGDIVDWLGLDPATAINPEEQASIRALQPDILACAKRHNTVKTNMDDNAFAALMTSILHWEGRLPGSGKPDWGPRWWNPLSEGKYHDRLGDILGLAGFESSVGIAKIRQSTAFMILKGNSPGIAGRFCYQIYGAPYLSINNLMDLGTHGLNMNQYLAQQLLDNKIALEFLATNLELGADRINALGYQASVFNLSTWYNGRAQTRQELFDNPAVLGYGNSMVATMPTALQLLFGSTTAGHYLPYNFVDADFIDSKLLRPH
jgi:hypothetical protein